MRKRMLSVMLMLCAVLLASGSVSAQQMEPTTYTFVAEWAIPRAQWNDYVAAWEKNNKPVLEKMAASGNLIGWGVYSFIVHGEDGMTHGVWWMSNTIAGIEKTREEALKVPPAPGMVEAKKHRDYYLRSLVHQGKNGSGSGYLSVSTSLVKPGQGQDWLNLWKKYTKPVYDDLLAKGIVTSYSVDVEDIHTMNPGWRFVVFTTANAAAEDQVAAAFEAAGAKRSAEENRAIGAAFRELLVPGEHWDVFLRVIASWHK